MLNGSFPTFDFDEGGIFVALVRGLFIVALFSSYGTLLYRVRLAGATLKAMPGKTGAVLAKRYDQQAVGSLMAALVTASAWLAVQAWVLFSSHGTAQLVHAIGETVLSTSFGHLLTLQMVLAFLALGCILAANRNATFRDLAVGLAGLAVVLQVSHDHAASMYDGFSLLLLSEIAHLLAGAAWLGSLVPLLITVRHAPLSVAHAVASRFSSFGTACVAVLAVTAAFQGWQLVGSMPGLIGTAYGLMAVVKIVLFAALLGLAASNRYRLTPKLGRSGGEPARAVLVRSVAIETMAGFAILIAASTLVTLPPSIHVQPVWPFTSKFSIVTVTEAPEAFSQVVLGLFALMVAVAIIAMGIYVRRLRWPAIAIAALIAWFALPPLGLLFVEAYPTSFHHSTTNFASTSIAEGSRLFSANCTGCHGAEGRGDGPLAGSLSEPPADLTAEHLWAHDDGELFWWLTDGIKSPEGEQAMPGFADKLSAEERWALIDYIRASNAGQHYVETGTWSPNLQAPRFQAECTGGTVGSGDLKGQVIRLVFGSTMPETRIPDRAADRLVTVLATPERVSPADGRCIARDPSLGEAYATVAGVAPRDLPGTEFLIDTNGWLRAVQKPGETISWNDPGRLEDQVIQLCEHPLGAEAQVHHHH